MHVQIHAKRFGETEEERDQPYFNSGAAYIPLEEGDKLTMEVSNGVITTTLNGSPQMSVSIGEYEYTALAICHGDPPQRKEL